MTTEHRELTAADIWGLLEAGCNANEIAAYCGVSVATAQAMMASARYAHVRAA